MKLFIATLIAALAALVAAGWSWDGDRFAGMSDGGSGGFRVAYEDLDPGSGCTLYTAITTGPCSPCPDPRYPC